MRMFAYGGKQLDHSSCSDHDAVRDPFRDLLRGGPHEQYLRCVSIAFHQLSGISKSQD